MLRYDFPDPSRVDDARIAFAVIVCRYGGRWVFCRHRERNTLEIPGGRREPGETVDDTARRELREETGATSFALERMGVYSVEIGGAVSYGAYYFADIRELGPLPPLEIGSVHLLDSLPENLTYPLIQPILWERVRDTLDKRSDTKGPP